MRIQIVRPCVESVQTGNVGTAHQWAAILESLGHDVTFSDGGDHQTADLLVVLHGEKGHDHIVRFREQCPGKAVVLALTGTDIYPHPDALVNQSMELADALVVLQEKAIQQIPDGLRAKAHVVIQAAQSMGELPLSKCEDPFIVCVAGHLRDVKDPMRAAKASRQLPVDSKIRIEHAGAILESKYQAMVADEERENPRYHYRGELSEADLGELMRRSQVTVISSLAEGGARVIGESIVEGTPVIATRIDGVTGLLGDDYPALFDVGDTAALAELLRRLESDATFRTHLNKETKRLASRFDPALERAVWSKLIGEFADS